MIEDGERDGMVAAGSRLGREKGGQEMELVGPGLLDDGPDG